MCHVGLPLVVLPGIGVRAIDHHLLTQALADAEPLARRASALLRPWEAGDAVLVHGDVDQKNLLLGADGPLLIDWDVVLPAYGWIWCG